MNYRFITRDSAVSSDPTAWFANIYRTVDTEDHYRGPGIVLVHRDMPLDVPPKMQNRALGDNPGDMPLSLMRGAASVTVDIPEGDGECYIAVFHRGPEGFQFIPSIPFHNLSADMADYDTVRSILYHSPYSPGSIMYEFVVLSAADMPADTIGANNVMWLYEADGIEHQRNGPLSYVSKMIGDYSMYFCTAYLPYPSSWVMVTNNNWLQPHSTGYVRGDTSGGGGTTVDLTEVLAKLDGLAQQITAESTAIKGKIDAIDLSSAGVPQNVIDMIMDLHAEALGSWTWDKRTGILTMLDTHGLEVATFTVADTPDGASRERRTDLELS